jgi:hypothetical protein
MRIYVAGPYSSDDPDQRLRNTERAMKAGRSLLSRGHAPFIPHLNHWFDAWATKQGMPVSYEQYLRWDAAFLEVCDALLVIGSSPGTETEIELASRMGLPILSPLAAGLARGGLLV